MKRGFLLFAAVVAIGNLSSAAHSSVIEFLPFAAGNISDGHLHRSFTSGSATPGLETFSDDWSFQLSTRARVFVELKDLPQLHNPEYNILKFEELLLVGPKLFSLDIPVPCGGPNPTDPDCFKVTYLDLAKGDYFVRVPGTAGDFNGGHFPPNIEAGYRYRIGLTAQVIPIPAAIWLFLTALGGLGVIGYRRAQSS